MSLCASSAALVALAVLASIGVFAGKTQAQATGDQMRGDIVVESRTDTSISGTYAYAGTKITFSSALDSASNTIYTSLIINSNKILQANEDLTQ